MAEEEDKDALGEQEGARGAEAPEAESGEETGPSPAGEGLDGNDGAGPEDGDGPGGGEEAGVDGSGGGAAHEGVDEDTLVDDDVWAAALREAEEAGGGGAGGEGEGESVAGEKSAGDGAGGGDALQVEARPADFSELSGNATEALANMEMILDIPVTVSVELGRAEMIIKDILQLGQGSVVELEKLAGEPMEILVNGRLVARGEVVMVEEKFGVRLTDIISPTERVKRLA